VFASRTLDLAWLAAPAAAFAALVIAHDRVIHSRDTAGRAAAFYEDGIARLEDRWAGRGDPGAEFAEPRHPYARDLDVFGRASLFELLCRARTPSGRATLARWLCEPAAPDAVRERQAAVRELAPRLDLREELALAAEDLRAQLEPEALASWGEAPRGLGSRTGRAAAAALVGASLAGIAAWTAGLAPPLAAAVPLAAQAAFAARLRRRTAPVIRSIDRAAHDLAILRRVVARLERERFETPRPAALVASLSADGAPASQRIAALERLVNLLDARRNQLFAPLAALLLWSTQLAFAIEAWRARVGPELRRWLAATGELEALSSLAGFAWENPGHVFPELAGGGPALFDGEGLGHPLLPRERCVPNDLRLGADGAGAQALVVSGSNMSGKSTLLRTVGANAVLALAGAPVRARRLRLSPLAIGASVLVADSLLEGKSRFFAEIERLRQVMDLAGAGRALFLLDEILQGTNSHDRRIGVEALLRGLLERGAVGLATTHDLALAEVADALAPRVANVHFEDHLEAGAMAFDYRLRPGVVRRSNALALMRAVGLEV
jgi:hypothetical protein